MVLVDQFSSIGADFVTAFNRQLELKLGSGSAQIERELSVQSGSVIETNKLGQSRESRRMVATIMVASLAQYLHVPFGACLLFFSSRFPCFEVRSGLVSLWLVSFRPHSTEGGFCFTGRLLARTNIDSLISRSSSSQPTDPGTSFFHLFVGE